MTITPAVELIRFSESGVSTGVGEAVSRNRSERAKQALAATWRKPNLGRHKPVSDDHLRVVPLSQYHTVTTVK